MRSRSLCIFVLVALCGAAYGQGRSHAVNIMGVIYYQVPGHAAPTIGTAPFNKEDVLKTVYSVTGTASGVSSVTDLDLVVNDETNAMDVITRKNATLVFELAQTGSNSVTLGPIYLRSKSLNLASLVQTDYEVKSESQGLQLTCYCNLHSHIYYSGADVQAINAYFRGGSVAGEAIQFEVIGHMRTTGKVYDVVSP
jgi:hypothetical protein